MPVRWKLYAVGNYLLAAGYAFLFIKAIKFTIETKGSSEDYSEFTPVMISFLIITLDCIFNLYIFHRHLPDRPLTKGLKKFVIIVAILLIVSLGIVLVSLFDIIIELMQTGDLDGFSLFLCLLFFSSVFLGIFIIYNQFQIARYIEKRYSDSINRVINEIGNEKTGEI